MRLQGILKKICAGERYSKWPHGGIKGLRRGPVHQSEAAGTHPSEPGAAGHCYSWTSYFPQDKGGTRPDTTQGSKHPSPKFLLKVPAGASEQKAEVKHHLRSSKLREEFVTPSYASGCVLLLIWKVRKSAWCHITSAQHITGGKRLLL